MKRFSEDYTAQLWWSFCLHGIGCLLVVLFAPRYADEKTPIGMLLMLNLICGLCMLFNISAMRRGNTAHFWLALLLSVLPCCYVYILIRAYGPLLVQQLIHS